MPTRSNKILHIIYDLYIYVQYIVLDTLGGITELSRLGFSKT